MRTRYGGTSTASATAEGGSERLGGYLLRAVFLVVMLVLLASLPGGDPSYDARWNVAEVDAALRDVLRQYGMREELVRDLILLGQRLGSSNGTLVFAVTAAQAELNSIRLEPRALAQHVPFDRFAVGQRQLGDATSRLLIELGNDRQTAHGPRLQALSARLGAIEKRIAIGREAYDKAVDRYNASLAVSPPDANADGPALRPRPTFRVIAETADWQT
ncbi:LemA family protein [Paraburkholderia graminis]|uniref:LemA family protein n=1 Tax=Paraburkholderia graminis TaxID=60548 RepID=UPI0038BBB415